MQNVLEYGLKLEPFCLRGNAYSRFDVGVEVEWRSSVKHPSLSM